MLEEPQKKVLRYKQECTSEFSRILTENLSSGQRGVFYFSIECPMKAGARKITLFAIRIFEKWADTNLF